MRPAAGLWLYGAGGLWYNVGMTACYPSSIREEELKNKVAADFFGAFDCTRIIGNVDFCVAMYYLVSRLEVALFATTCLSGL